MILLLLAQAATPDAGWEALRYELAEEPQALRSWVGLLQVAARTGSDAVLVDLADQAPLELLPPAAREDVHYLRGLQAVFEGRDGSEDFTQVPPGHRRYPEAQLQLGVSWAADRDQRAGRALQLAAEAPELRDRAVIELARLYADTGVRDEALRLYELTPQDSEWFFTALVESTALLPPEQALGRLLALESPSLRDRGFSPEAEWRRLELLVEACDPLARPARAALLERHAGGPGSQARLRLDLELVLRQDHVRALRAEGLERPDAERAYEERFRELWADLDQELDAVQARAAALAPPLASSAWPPRHEIWLDEIFALRYEPPGCAELTADGL